MIFKREPHYLQAPPKTPKWNQIPWNSFIKLLGFWVFQGMFQGVLASHWHSSTRILNLPLVPRLISWISARLPWGKLRGREGSAQTCGSLASSETSHIQLEKSEWGKVWGHGFKVVFFFLGGLLRDTYIPFGQAGFSIASYVFSIFLSCWPGAGPIVGASLW